MTLDGLWVGQVAMAALMNIAFAFAIGAALLAGWLADHARAPKTPGHPAWLRAQRSMLAACVVLVLADLVWLVYQAASMAGVALPDAFGQLPIVLGQTQIGRAWCVAFAGALLLTATALAPRAGNLRNGLLWLAVIVCAAGKASLGHAADDGPVSGALAVHTLHVLSTSVWGGLALAAGLSVLPALGASTARGVLIQSAQRISSTSVAAVVLVVLTGIANAWRGSGGSLHAIEAGTWGHVLMLKLALIGMALVLGGMNRYSALPRLRRSASTVDAHTFANILYLEAIVMIGVFVAAAALAHSVPGSSMAG